MVAFSQSDESSDNVITRRIAVIEWLVAEPVGQRVDAEGCLLNEEDSKDSCVDEPTHPITPSKTSDQAREDHSHEYNGFDIVAVLPNDNRVIVQIGDIGTTNALWVLLHDHPSKVGVEETLSNRVWVLVGVGISVMSTVIS